MKHFILPFPTVLIFLNVFLISPLWAQNLPDLDVEGAIYGQVLDKESGQPLEYATVALYSFMSDDAVKGMITDDQGQFSFKEVGLGAYNLEISFLGYKKTVINQILVLPKNPEIFLGEIEMQANVEQLEQVVISGQREEMIIKADRKVIDIESNVTARGGTLVEALENQPSVKTDMDGNMTLRGSSNFMVLVNGKPTALKGSNALQQIPANTVARVEIITNPSAKFDAEGEAGIINVITKKDFSEGFSGSVNGGAGFTGNFLLRYSSDATAQVTRDKMTFSLGLNAQYSPLEGDGDRTQETYGESDTLYRTSQMDIGIYRSNQTLKSGWIYVPNVRNTFSAELSLGRSSFERDFFSDIDEDVSDQLYSTTTAEDDKQFFSSTVGYEHLFDLSSGHKISANIFFSTTSGDKEDALSEEAGESSAIVLDQVSTEENDLEKLRLNVDYQKPLGAGNDHLEMGYQWRYETTDLNQTSDITSPDEMTFTENTILLTRDIHAWYLQWGGEHNSLSYQVGMRPEITYREISQTQDEASKNYFNLFPSANLAYSFSSSSQLKLGYSKRINRPQISQLNPYVQLIDDMNRRSGNVDLLPEYIHSFELSWLKRFMLSFLSADLFYRQTEDKMSPVWLLESDDLLLLTYDNLDQDYSYGTEIMGSFQLTSWWRLSGSTSIYRYNINGDVSGEEVNNTSNSWNARLSALFRIEATNTSIQFNVIYNSEVASSQGKRKGFYATMLGVKQQLLKNKLDASLQVRDVFSTIRFSNESSSAYFINEMMFYPYTPVVSLNISYRFNNYKKNRHINSSEINQMDFQEDFGF